MHEWACSHDEAPNCQLLIALAFWIIWKVSTQESPSLTQNMTQICCCTVTVILNVTATKYTYSLNSVYCPHWLGQWSHLCSHEHSSLLSLATRLADAAQTVLVILTMAELFLDRPHIYSLWNYISTWFSLILVLWNNIFIIW